MKSTASHRELSCSACHGAHTFDTRQAAVESCMDCHDDAHTLAYQDSTHYALWRAELDGSLPPGSGVSCATCHLPRERHAEGSTTRVLVQHNQNANLRPNEKMLRTVCLDCHGLGFALDALADPALVRANFRGRPSRHIESLDLAERRRRELQKTNHREP
jgi:formate-dependent nitrite reductase cytochrome c552 subunit